MKYMIIKKDNHPHSFWNEFISHGGTWNWYSSKKEYTLINAIQHLLKIIKKNDDLLSNYVVLSGKLNKQGNRVVYNTLVADLNKCKLVNPDKISWSMLLKAIRKQS